MVFAAFCIPNTFRARQILSDQKVYVDVDDMKHLSAGHGIKQRVDEIILPQKAYKGGGLL